MFLTLTNVNFNCDRHLDILEKLAKLRTIVSNGDKNVSVFKRDLQYLLREANKWGLVKRKARINNLDLFGLHEMAIYGMKGGAAYLYHAEGVRRACKDPEAAYKDLVRDKMFQGLFEVMAELLNEKLELGDLLGLCLKVGEVNVTILASLDSGHNQLLGTPEPAEVNRTPIEGKCILISGHDMVTLKKLLEQIESSG